MKEQEAAQGRTLPGDEPQGQQSQIVKGNGPDQPVDVNAGPEPREVTVRIMLRPTKNPLSAKNTSRQKIPPQNSITFGFIPMEKNPECPIQTRAMAATRAISRPIFLVLFIELPLCWIFLPTIAWERKCVKQGAEEHRIHGIFIFIKIDVCN